MEEYKTLYQLLSKLSSAFEDQHKINKSFYELMQKQLDESMLDSTGDDFDEDEDLKVLDDGAEEAYSHDDSHLSDLVHSDVDDEMVKAAMTQRPSELKNHQQIAQYIDSQQQMAQSLTSEVQKQVPQQAPGAPGNSNLYRNLNCNHKLEFPTFEVSTTIVPEMFDESPKKGKLEVVIESKLKDKIGEENDKSVYEAVGEVYEVHSTVEIEVFVGCKIEAKRKIGTVIKLIGEFDIGLEVALEEKVNIELITFDSSHDWGGVVVPISSHEWQLINKKKPIWLRMPESAPELLLLPLYVDVNVNRPLLNVRFHQAQVNVIGSVVCKEKCDTSVHDILERVGDGSKTKRKTISLSDQSNEFLFPHILPGNYKLQVTRQTPGIKEDSWCWDQNSFGMAAGIKFWDMDNTNKLTSTDADGGLPNLPCLRFNKKGNLPAVTTGDNGIKILANAAGLRSLRSVEAMSFEALRSAPEPAATKIYGISIIPNVSPVNCKMESSFPVRPSPILNGFDYLLEALPGDNVGFNVKDAVMDLKCGAVKIFDPGGLTIFSVLRTRLLRGEYCYGRF